MLFFYKSFIQYHSLRLRGLAGHGHCQDVFTYFRALYIDIARKMFRFQCQNTCRICSLSNDSLELKKIISKHLRKIGYEICRKPSFLNINMKNNLNVLTINKGFIRTTPIFVLIIFQQSKQLLHQGTETVDQVFHEGHFISDKIY